MCAEWEGPGEAAHRFSDLMGPDEDQITEEMWLLSLSAQRKKSRTLPEDTQQYKPEKISTEESYPFTL